MTIVLPFTCEQINKFASICWKILKTVVLIGCPSLIIFSIVMHDLAGIVFGITFSAMAWCCAIVFWVADGKIRCKCESKEGT